MDGSSDGVLAMRLKSCFLGEMSGVSYSMLKDSEDGLAGFCTFDGTHRNTIWGFGAASPFPKKN